MADPNNAPRKKWWEWLFKDVAISGIVAAVLDYAAKNFGPKALDKLSSLLGDHVTKKYLEDRRAEIVDDLRKMETSTPPVNTDRLWARHAKAIADLREDRFVLLLCKIIADQKDPTMGRQATLKWLNDMDDAKFNQTLFMLDQDNHIQAFQRWRDRAARIRKDISNGLKNFKQWMSARFGVMGLWIATAAENVWEFLLRFFRWLFGSQFRIVVFAIISLVVSVLFFGFLRNRGVTRVGAAREPIGTTRGPTRVAVSSLVGAAIVVSLIAIAYHKLVPISNDIDLWHYGVLLLLVGAFFFWRVARLRYALLVAALFIAPIFFLGGRTVAKAEAKTVWAAATKTGNDDVSTRHQKTDKGASFSSNGATTLPEERRQLTSGGNASTGEDNNLAMLTAPQTPPPQQVAERACPSLPQPIEYGDFTFVLTHCGVRGNQVRLSGNIQYGGQEKTNMYFHPFKAHDDAGDIYVVQNGRFGDSDNFGLGHSGQWMYPPTSVPYSVPFSLELGPENGNLPPAANVTLIMPCSDQLGSQIVLQLALK